MRRQLSDLGKNIDRVLKSGNLARFESHGNKALNNALRMNFNVIRAILIIHEASPALGIEKQKYSVIAKHFKDERNVSHLESG